MKVDFNHAMVYVSNVERARDFYAGVLGFKLLDEVAGFYARVRSPGSDSTIALHKAEPGSTGIRLYFESDKLDQLCGRLKKAGLRFDKEPADMPWGWRHAYLRDPDGHEISLYFAGSKRLRVSKPKRSSPRKRKGR